MSRQEHATFHKLEVILVSSLFSVFVACREACVLKYTAEIILEMICFQMHNDILVVSGSYLFSVEKKKHVLISVLHI